MPLSDPDTNAEHMSRIMTIIEEEIILIESPTEDADKKTNDKICSKGSSKVYRFREYSKMNSFSIFIKR